MCLWNFNEFDLFFCLLFGIFETRSLYYNSSSCPGTYYIEQAGREFRDSPASANVFLFLILGLEKAPRILGKYSLPLSPSSSSYFMFICFWCSGKLYSKQKYVHIHIAHKGTDLPSGWGSRLRIPVFYFCCHRIWTFLKICYHVCMICVGEGRHICHMYLEIRGQLAVVRSLIQWSPGIKLGLEAYVTFTNHCAIG